MSEEISRRRGRSRRRTLLPGGLAALAPRGPRQGEEAHLDIGLPWLEAQNLELARLGIEAVLYCDCRASAGWTAAARCAGIQLAMNATARRAAVVALSVTRSVGLTP